MAATLLITSICAALAGTVEGHGRLIEPPSRSTMWRYGFNTPPNYNDHELYCGGFTRQWKTNGGKCGICGDPWDSPQPRQNEAGGTYGQGVIARKYRKNQSIKVKVELTANHMGHFEFRICPNNKPRKPASQICLNRYLLVQSDGQGPSFKPGAGNKVFEMNYRLPKDLTCTQCVFQWRYIAGNNWGHCKNGSSLVGCGPQEEFRACSDITITENDGTASDIVNNEVDPAWPDVTNNEVEYTDQGRDVSSQDEDLGVERTVIVVLASLLFVLVLFGTVFFYYYKCRYVVKQFLAENDLSLPEVKMSLPKVKLPSLARLKSVKVRKMCNLDKLSRVNWPLSNISLNNKLPTFKTSALATITRVGSGDGETGPVPVPPPRLKKQRAETPGNTSSDSGNSSGSSHYSGSGSGNSSAAAASGRKSSHYASSNVIPAGGPRLATITPRPHTARPPAPPPVAPPVRPSVPTLEIGPPTSVTINGVTVAPTSPVPPPDNFRQKPRDKKAPDGNRGAPERTPPEKGKRTTGEKRQTPDRNVEEPPLPERLIPERKSQDRITQDLYKNMAAPSGPRPSSEGVICSALPAVVLSDMPDSLDGSDPSSLKIVHPCAGRPAAVILSQDMDVPPPLPSCPPPDSLQEYNTTDA